VLEALAVPPERPPRLLLEAPPPPRAGRCAVAMQKIVSTMGLFLNKLIKGAHKGN
jgi:hypothetical protein